MHFLRSNNDKYSMVNELDATTEAIQDPTTCFACIVAKTTVCSIAYNPNLKPPAGMVIASTVAARSVDCGPLSIKEDLQVNCLQRSGALLALSAGRIAINGAMDHQIHMIDQFTESP
jgi:hypothetical protein